MASALVSTQICGAAFPGCADVNWFVDQEELKENQEAIKPDETDYYLALCNKLGRSGGK